MFWNRSRICGGIKNTKEEPFREAPGGGRTDASVSDPSPRPQEDGEETREWQTEAVCWDGIHVEKERPCITERPEGASFDFRDPKVQRIEGMDYMVLGSSLDGVPSILLYVRENGAWSFKGPLLQEHEPGIRTFECPDFLNWMGNMWPQVYGCATAMRPAGIR